MFWKLKQKFSGNELVDMLQEAQERWDIDVKEESSGGLTVEGVPLAAGVNVKNGDTIRTYIFEKPSAGYIFGFWANTNDGIAYFYSAFAAVGGSDVMSGCGDNIGYPGYMMQSYHSNQTGGCRFDDLTVPRILEFTYTGPDTTIIGGDTAEFNIIMTCISKN